jgi:hypothetical protein
VRERAEAVAELQGMPGMHRHTLQVWEVTMYVYVFLEKKKKKKHL